MPLGSLSIILVKWTTYCQCPEILLRLPRHHALSGAEERSSRHCRSEGHVGTAAQRLRRQVVWRTPNVPHVAPGSRCQLDILILVGYPDGLGIESLRSRDMAGEIE